MDTHAATQSQLEKLLTEQELADQLNVEPTLLERGRQTGTGPPFVRVAPRTIRYQPSAVAAWLATRIAGRVKVSAGRDNHTILVGNKSELLGSSRVERSP